MANGTKAVKKGLAESMFGSNTKLIIGLIIGAASALGGIALWKILLNYAVLSGRVVDSTTLQPLSGAKVELFGSEGTYLEQNTNSEGVYNFSQQNQLQTSYIAQGFPYYYYYTLRVQMPGYEDFLFTQLLLHPAGNTLDVLMTPLEGS